MVHIVPCGGIGGVEIAAQAAADAGVYRAFFLDAQGPFGLRSLRGGLAAAKAELALFSLWKSVAALVLARLLAPHGKYVVLLHNAVAAHPIDATVTWLMCRLASEVWADSPEVLAHRRRVVGRKRRRVVSFVLDRLPAQERTEPAPKLIYWGRLHPNKMLNEAVQVVAQLKKRGVPAELDIYGPDAGAGQAVLQSIRSLGVESAVRLQGPVRRTDLPTIAADKSFFIHTGSQEGAALAVVEALQLGLVPIVTPVGAMARYAALGHRYGSAADAAAWIERLLQDAQRYRELSRACASATAAAPCLAESLLEHISAAKREIGTVA